MLTKEELKQYNRQLILPELGINGQEKLKAAKVLMIGAGGLGCPVLQYLVAAGVGIIGIADDDKVEVSNLHRQILYSHADLGEPKATIAQQKLRQLNPFVNIIAHQERVTNDNAAKLISQYDLIIDGSDNFPTRYLVNDTCVALGKTLIFGSIFKFEGQVSVFNYQQGPNYRDVFPEAPAENEVPNCSETGVIGVLPGIIGTYMANEVIKIICGFGETLTGKLLTLNALDNSLNLFKISPQKQEILMPNITKNQSGNSLDTEISLEVLETWLADTPEKVHLVDVREGYEFEEYNLGGENISVYDLAEHISLFPPDKKLVFICQSGVRSKMAVNIARPLFNGEIFSVAGGIS
ncbi:molybdopterin-synthase adenylyltransferase MoeB [Pedobacter petrophilus]|uniref:Molybdopterin-synthase adenylyltransferase n=1 Tax=Pedobacter petrophilus TaxID=1908241 RepID=A0A7K0FXA2_9SPHI|nr:HesA/MoeB/ThiF family protein [Pedobacter petrophilus]MRX75684.1 molybdopterin-synthase adenylyltransferase MoeB [Pedobacter petrophilus]